MRKIEDDVLDNGGSGGNNGPIATNPDANKKTTGDKVFIAFGVVVLVVVVAKALGLF